MPDDHEMQSGRLDPKTLDAAAKGKRRRKRHLPEPRPELKEWAKGAEARAKARPYPPGIMLEPAGFDQEHWTAPHSDPDLWTLQLAEAFGTRSLSVISTFMRQLEALCRPTDWDDKARQWRLDEHEFSALLGIVSAAKPRNELEAAQVAQMVAVHLMAMKLAARALKYDGDIPTAAVAGKLARTFTLQMEALQSGRRRKPAARQTITVRKETHQHVHYHDNRGAAGNERQPHGRAITAADRCAALPSPDESGNVLPLSSRKGQGKV